MNNNLIMWSMFFVPWLTLFFMKRDDIKRYAPVGLLSIVTTVIIYDIGTALGYWTLRQSFFPLNYLKPYFFGTMPVLTMWIFKFTEKKFWTYMITNTILDIGFNFFLLAYFFPLKGIWDFNIRPLFSLPITLGHAIVLYVYQIWQDDALLSLKDIKKYKVQPAAAKPQSEDQNDKKGNE